MKNTYFKPRCILLVPLSKGKYEEHLRRKGLFSRSEIEEAVSRVDMYINMSEDFPGYFDAIIYIGKLISFRTLNLISKVTPIDGLKLLGKQSHWQMLN